jgi:hypothetical protein
VHVAHANDLAIRVPIPAHRKSGVLIEAIFESLRSVWNCSSASAMIRAPPQAMVRHLFQVKMWPSSMRPLI